MGKEGRKMGKRIRIREEQRTIITPTPILNPPSLKISSPILSFDEQPTRGE
jgi:hypothetical protein